MQQGSAGCAQLMYGSQQRHTLLSTSRVAVKGVIDVLREGASLRTWNGCKVAQLLHPIGVASSWVHGIKDCHLSVHLQTDTLDMGCERSKTGQITCSMCNA